MSVKLTTACSYGSLARLQQLQHVGKLRLPETVSQESQQLDEAKRIDLIAEHHRNLKKILQASKPTGHPNLYVLEPEQLAHGDLDAQSTLQALASAKFNDRELATVALLPPEEGYSEIGVGAESLVKQTALAHHRGIVLTSLEALDEYLGRL